MKLVVGLGNPGSQYEGTRHNVGFDVVKRIAEKHQLGTATERFRGLCYDWEHLGHRVLLVCPLTFMNLSGVCVNEFVRFFKIDTNEVLVLCDDLDLPLGVTRLREKGTGGGQRGLADILTRMGTNEVSRLRLGIGRPQNEMDASSFVLQRFSDKELDVMQRTVEFAASAVELWIGKGSSVAMNLSNGRIVN